MDSFIKGIVCITIILANFASKSEQYDHNIKPTIFTHDLGLPTERPLVIGHRGSCGVKPDHTVPSYQQAVDDGSDMLECDVCITKDLKLICRHESQLSKTTNVASIAKFAGRKRTHSNGVNNLTDWFTFDFTLDELMEIGAIQPFSFRDQSFNGNFTISTFEEHIRIAKSAGRPVGIYPEIKTPSFVNSIPGLFPNGTRYEDIVVRELNRYGYTKPEDGAIIQCFEEESLVYIKETLGSNIPLTMCVEANVDDATLTRYSQQGFYGVCAWKDQIYSTYRSGSYKHYVYQSTDFVERCHRKGFKVHLYTFRNEDRYLGWDFEQDVRNEYDKFFQHDVDGYFTDFPATLVYYLDNIYRDKDAGTVSSGAAGSNRGYTVIWLLMAIFAYLHF